MRIVAIGGGELEFRETLRIDRFIVELTGRCSPSALFIPTASGDAPGYCQTFDRIYGRRLGCRTEHLCLLGRPEDRSRMAERIRQADLVYVGGGNTLRMMRLWRRLGVDKLLARAGKDGTVLSGLSAGAICWHEWGHSDSRAFAGTPRWNHIRVTGLGFEKGIFCPHVDAEKRHRPFGKMVVRHGVLGIACDNHAAVYYDGSKAVAVSSRAKARAWVYRERRGRLIVDGYADGEPLEI